MSSEIPEKKWKNPFTEETPLYEKFGRIVSQNRDIIIIIDDMQARRGTGKTVASLLLADKMDQTEEGVTKDKVSMDPREIREAYAERPKRSGLVFDEGEVGASNRQAMTKTNQALREIMSMGRVEEKYLVVNTPALDFIDKDIQKLADVWIGMEKKGVGLVHFLEREAYSGKLLKPKKQRLHFSDITKGSELREVYNYLTQEKQKRIRGDEGSGYIEKTEHKQQIQKAREQAARDKRDELIKSIYNHPKIDIEQSKLGDITDLTQSGVSRILNPNN